MGRTRIPRFSLPTAPDDAWIACVQTTEPIDASALLRHFLIAATSAAGSAPKDLNLLVQFKARRVARHQTRWASAIYTNAHRQKVNGSCVAPLIARGRIATVSCDCFETGKALREKKLSLRATQFSSPTQIRYMWGEFPV